MNQESSGAPPVQEELDPFLVAPFLTAAARWNSWWFTCTFPLLGGLIFFAAAIEGTLGNPSDFQPLVDLRRIFGFAESPALPAFPLLRDVASWFLVCVASATCVLVHRQWQLMRLCIRSIAETGAVKPLKEPDYRRIHKMVLLPRLLDGAEDYRHLDALVKSVNRGMAKVGLFNVLPSFMAVLLTVVVIVGVSKNGLFGVLSPPGLSAAAEGDWLHRAYESWWASLGNRFGLIAYGAMACIGIFVILVQNLVGFFCVYIIICMPAVVELDADWLNRDGSYGWRDFARTYRSTVWSLALHGFGLSVLLVALGIRNFPSILGLVALWVVVVPFYIILPSRVFRNVQAAAKERRISVINAVLVAEGINESDVSRWQPFRDEIDKINSARINPLKIRPFELPAFLVVVILPIILTAAQIVLPLSLSGK
jgi:hypothetical protein